MHGAPFRTSRSVEHAPSRYSNRGWWKIRALLRFPKTHGDRAFFSVGSMLLASLGTSDGDALATVTFDRQRDALQLQGLVPWSGQMRAFGGDGLLVLTDDRRIVRYTVSSTGVVNDAGVVPDPAGYYLDRSLPAFFLLRFHPSWRLGYIVGATTVHTFGVAASGQLTLVDETALPEQHGADPSRVGVILGPAS